MKTIVIPLTQTLSPQLSKLAAEPNTQYVLIERTSQKSPENIFKKRVNNDLYIQLEDSEETFIVESYYTADNVSVVGMNNAGTYVQYAPGEGGLYNLDAANTGSSGSAGILGATALLGALVAKGMHRMRDHQDDGHVTAEAPEFQSSITPAALSAVTNKVPTDVVLSTDALAANQDGAVVGRLTTKDTDASDTHTYTVNDERFEVVNGELKLKAGQKVESATASTINLTVTTTDKAGASYSEDFMINVKDNLKTGDNKESGMLLDIARKFYHPDVIKGFIDDLAGFGGDFLHLHASDTQNFALESNLLGQTTSNARQNAQGVWTNNSTGKPFLSDAQIADIVNHAKTKGIEIVVEIDAPAHTKGIYDLTVLKHGLSNAQKIFDTSLDPNYPELKFNEPDARQFMKSLYSEAIDKFQAVSQHFHIGGDEFSIAADDNHLFVDYANEMIEFLADKGLTARLWNDGVLKSSLDKQADIQLDKRAEVTFWSLDGNRGDPEQTEYNRTNRAGVPDLLAADFEVLNYNDSYLYHNPTAHDMPEFGVSKSSDTSLFARNDGQRILSDWHLGVWDEDDRSSAVSSSAIKGAAISLWGEHAADIDDASIRLFNQARLSALVKKTEAANDTTGASEAQLNDLKLTDFASLDQPFYLDFEHIENKQLVDLSGAGKDRLMLLNEVVLQDKGNLSVYIEGGLQADAAESQRDSVMLGENWQKQGTQDQYTVYQYERTKLLIENDVEVVVL